MDKDMKNNCVNHSGGAVGADFEWDCQGAHYGVVSRHYWHGRRTPYGNVEITEADYEEGCRHVLQANRRLRRKPERYMDLLARDWCQVKYSEAVFAIGYLQHGFVKGGTGWAVQMAIDEGKPVWLFDQERKEWLSYRDGEWCKCDVPVLTPDFAGIGSRNITESGIRAIGEVYKKTFPDEITLLDGRTLRCFPKKEAGVPVDNSMRLDTTGVYLTIGRQKSAAPKPVSEDLQAARKFFTDHAFFFLDHKEQILGDSRMFLAPVSIQSGMAYIGTGGFRRPTLGVYIEWWMNCVPAVIENRHKTRWLVYHIAGSPLSGINRCGIVNPQGECRCESVGGSFGALWSPFVNINRRYDKAKERFEAYSLEEVVERLDAGANLC